MISPCRPVISARALACRHAYDFDTRVPLLVRGPGIAPSSTLEEMVTLVDLAPTILEMAGVDDAAVSAAGLAQIDGRSMLPLLVAGARRPAARAAQRPTRGRLRSGDGRRACTG